MSSRELLLRRRAMFAGAAVPTNLNLWNSTSASGLPFTLSLAAPSGTVSGDRMVAMFTGISFTGAQGRDGTFTPSGSWTELYRTTGSSGRLILAVFTKVADANDQAGSVSYTWQVSGSASPAYQARISYGTIPQQYGTTFTSPQSNGGYRVTSTSTGAAGGNWQLALALTKNYQTAGDSSTPTLTTGGTQVFDSFGIAATGKQRAFIVPTGGVSMTWTSVSVDWLNAQVVLGVS